MVANNLRALVIDDTPAMRQLLWIVLRGLGISQVAEAENGRDALANLADGCSANPDFIVCDLKMGEMPGIEFIYRLRQSRTVANPGVPVFVLTGEDDPAVLDAATGVGANSVRRKPIMPRLLREDIESSLGYRVAGPHCPPTLEAAWSYSGKGSIIA
ncbi:MAG: response regulator [Proteobacteria bacterium]|nr:response regulator [Pseudomonadota bacterium]